MKKTQVTQLFSANYRGETTPFITTRICDFLRSTMINYHFAPFGRIFLEHFPSIFIANPSRLCYYGYANLYYCWWLKFCTTWDVHNPVNNGINYLSTGAGFLASTVVFPVLWNFERFVIFVHQSFGDDDCAAGWVSMWTTKTVRLCSSNVPWRLFGAVHCVLR